MTAVDPLSRRKVLQGLTLALPLLPVAGTALAADAPPLLSPEAPEAKALKYVDDAAKAKGARPNSHCANCGLYQGKAGAAAGPCQIFPGKQVKATGWCASWAPQM